MASDDGASKESQIKKLSDDVKEAGVRIQEKEAELIQHDSEVLSDLRVTLAEQEEIIENQRMEIELLKCHVKEKTFQLNTQEKHGQGAAEEMTAIKSGPKHRNSIKPMIQVLVCTNNVYGHVHVSKFAFLCNIIIVHMQCVTVRC